MRPEYADLCAAFTGRRGVTQPEGGRAFGSDALKVAGSIFAMDRDGLVLKLPAVRVAELIANGTGTPFDAGKGKPLKEWVRVADPAYWEGLAEEAYHFVGKHGVGKRGVGKHGAGRGMGEDAGHE
ncbi:MAG: hypothetical protein JWP14_1473 [Frankiales bacterium]|nr:hypothetical protein [Frankiales bacterium]